jgi:carboxymethylenebutenolidase
VLSVADGNRLSAFAAHPEGEAKLQALVMGDAGGMRVFYRAFVVLLAELEIDAVTFDYYGRTAGPTEHRDDSFEFMPHLQALTSEGVLADARFACDYLRERADGERPIVALGFCMGGVSAIRLALDAGPIGGVVAFYPPMGFRLFGEGTLELATRVRTPLLALFGNEDTVIPPDQIESFRGALAASEAEHEVVVYRGAGHGFFEQSHPQIAAEAWEKLLAFLDARSGIRQSAAPRSFDSPNA